MKWGDIQPTMFMKNGLEHEGYRYSWKGKGKPGRSIAEMPRGAMIAILAYVEMLESEMGRKLSPSDYLFIGLTARAKPGAPIYSATVDHLFRRYAKLAGIGGQHSTHSWRHTAAKVRHEEGEGLLDLMKFLGHADPKVTLAYLEGIAYEGDSMAHRLLSRYSGL